MPRLNEKPIPEKYRDREWEKIRNIYHNVANQIIDEAKKLEASTIVLEQLKNIRKNNHDKALNGRLNRCMSMLETTSSLCPICGEKAKPEWIQVTDRWMWGLYPLTPKALP